MHRKPLKESYYDGIIRILRGKLSWLTGAILLAIALVGTAQAGTVLPFVLTGVVTSQAEGPMEGVSVIAQRDSSTILTSVTTNAQGEYKFPQNRLKVGNYSITVRAPGYELPDLARALIQKGAQAPAHLNLRLSRVTDPSRLASQLTNLEWINSIPGTPRQKDLLVRNIGNCGFCHSLERVMRSTHTADDFLHVIQRMLTYDPDHTSPGRPQVTAELPPIDHLLYHGVSANALATYLASINLSDGKTTWPYPLNTMPRPKGRSTHLIVTVYPVPRQPSVVHDLDVDSKGNIWYGNTGWDYIGKLDANSGSFREWPAPNYLPSPKSGLDRLQGVQDIQVDPNDNVWAAIGGTQIAMFDTKTETWSTFPMPISRRSSFISPFRPGSDTVWTAGLTQNADGTQSLVKAFRLHFPSGKVDGGFAIYDNLPPLNDPDHFGVTHSCYMMDRDTSDNFICTDAGGSNIVRVDAKTGEAKLYPTPTPWAFPRRGYTDAQNRFWFGEFYADKVGVLDLNKESFQEFPVPNKYISPYYARPDKNGEIWISSTGSDRLIRLNPMTGETLFYMMPVYYDARKVVVDLSARVTTIWLPNKNTSQLIRVEVLD